MSGYLAFEYTKIKEVDDILAALDWAGRCYHCTSDWNNKDCSGCESQIELIQKAANICAEKIKKLTTANNIAKAAD